MAEYFPKFQPGAAVTVVATAAVVGGRLISLNGQNSAADSTTVLGVAAQDVQTGDAVAYFRDGLHRLVAGATITAGQFLKAGANGTVVPWVEGTDGVSRLIGKSLSAAAANASVDATLQYI